MNNPQLPAFDHCASAAARTSTVCEALAIVDRALFVPEDLRAAAYEDRPLPIGYGQTISQPSTVAIMLELLDVSPGQTVLDVGSGSGYTTALLAHLAGPEGRVYGVERIGALVTMGQDNIARAGVDTASIEPAGEELGLPAHAPYDRILVSAAAQEIPRELCAQLAEGGIMVIPVGSDILRIERTAADDFTIDRQHGFAFVPLVTS